MLLQEFLSTILLGLGVMIVLTSNGFEYTQIFFPTMRAMVAFTFFPAASFYRAACLGVEYPVCVNCFH